MLSDFNKNVIRIGKLTVACAIVANFVPVFYIWLVKGYIPTGAKLMELYGLVFASFAVSWVVQPLSYYGGLGMVGSYISWIAGSAADIRMPAITMAQKVSGTEANTPAGDAIGALALASTVFTTVSIITIFTFIGSVIIPMLPKVVTDSFRFMQPALFAAVFVNMAVKNLKAGMPSLAMGLLCCFLLPKLGVPAAVVTLSVVSLGMLIAAGEFKMSHKA